MAEWASKVTSGLLQRLIDNELSLRALTLELDQPLTTKEAALLGEALKGNKITDTLNLEWCGLGPDGLKKLSSGLCRNKGLVVLNLCSNSLGAPGASHLSSLLASNYCLRDLDLSRNQLGASGMKKLAVGLAPNVTLRRLDVSHNDLGVKGGAQLGWALKRNVALESVSVSGNGLGAAGVKDITDSLRYNTALHTLDLDFNDLGPSAAELIAEALKVNRSVKKLSLAANELDVAGARSLSYALKTNDALVSLDVSGHPLSGRPNIGAEGATVLLIGLSANVSLTELNLDINAVSNESMRDIQALLQTKSAQNRTPEKLLSSLETPLAKSVRKLFPDDGGSQDPPQPVSPKPQPARKAPPPPSTGDVQRAFATPLHKPQGSSAKRTQSAPAPDRVDIADALEATLARLSHVLGDEGADKALQPETSTPVQAAADDLDDMGTSAVGTTESVAVAHEALKQKLRRKVSGSLSQGSDSDSDESLSNEHGDDQAEEETEGTEFVEAGEVEEEEMVEEMGQGSSEEDYALDAMVDISLDGSSDCVDEGLDTPSVVVRSLTLALQRLGLGELGLFRVNGDDEQVTKLLDLFRAGEEPLKSRADIKQYDAHTLSSALKQYLRTMRQQPLPSTLFHELVDIGTAPSPAERVGRLHELLQEHVEYSDRVLLRNLGRFLKEVAAKSSSNKMDTANLAAVFVPSLIRAPVDASPDDLLKANRSLRRVVQTLIENVNDVI